VQACKSRPSFFVVESIEPGRAIDLKDILTGRRFHVLEQSASRTLRAGDVTFTRVVTAGGASIMIGASPWIIPPAWHLRVIDFRDQLRPRRPLTVDDLIEYDLEIREFYHQVIDAILHPALPSLQNTDGDPVELTTMTYELVFRRRKRSSVCAHSPRSAAMRTSTARSTTAQIVPEIVPAISRNRR
jgi:hypothetical protein